MVKLFSKVIITFLFCSLHFGVLAQVNIKGTLLDEEGVALPFANVVLKNTTYGTSTAENGSFSLSDIPAGIYTLSISMLGYQTIDNKIDVTTNNDVDLGQINMPASALGLNEVVVTGTMDEIYLKHSPVKIDVVTKEFLAKNTSPQNVVEGISLINGVQEVVACGVCFTNSITINGLPGPYTAILMDGSPIYGNLASVYGLNGIPIMLIDRFEVIKGPVSTLYGSEAVAGVINIITRDPDKEPLFSIDLMGTTHLEAFTNVALAPKFKRASGFIGFNHAFLNRFDDKNNDGFGDNIAMDRYSAFTKWSFKRKSGKKFTLAGKYYYEDRRNGVEQFIEDRAYRELRGNDSIYGESIYTERIEVFGTYELPTKERLQWDYTYSFHNQDSYYGSDRYTAKQHIGFSNFLWRKQAGQHNILAGTSFRFQGYDDNSAATGDTINGQFVNQVDNQYIPGLIIQDDWQIHERFTILAGIRVDYYRRHGVIPAPRLSLKYNTAAQTTLRLNFGTGFRIVNLFTEDHAFVTGQRSVEIVEELSPETTYSTNLNINQAFTIGNTQGMIDIDGHFTYFTNKIVPDYDTPGQIVYANSDGYAITTGIGINWVHQLSFPLSITAGFNYQRVTQTEYDDNDEPVTSDIEFAPKWTGVGIINYTWRKVDLDFAYTVNITGPMALPEVFDVDTETGELLTTSRPTTSIPFAISNLQITKKFKKINFQVYGGIQNLFNYRQRESPLVGVNDPGQPAGFSPNFDTAYAYSPMHGREFYIGFRWNVSPKKEKQN